MSTIDETPVQSTDDLPLVAYRFPVGPKEEIQAYLQTYKGEQQAHLRRFQFRKRDGLFVPTPKGVAVQVDLLPSILKAVVHLMATVEGDGVSG